MPALDAGSDVCASMRAVELLQWENEECQRADFQPAPDLRLVSAKEAVGSLIERPLPPASA
jgi:hypothetical protein